MPKIRRVDFSADEWLSGTIELSDVDRGIYITICALIWSRGGRINEELVRRHSRSHGNTISASLARLENAGKIVRNGLEIGQKRAENELENARIRSQLGSEKASKRWHNNTVEDDPALQGGNPNHQLSTTNYQLPERERESARANGSQISAGPIPEDWRPNEAHRQQAMLLAKDDAWLAEQAEMFRDHFLAKGKLTAEPDAEFRNWLRKSPGFEPRRNGRSSDPPVLGDGFASGEVDRRKPWERDHDVHVALWRKNGIWENSWEGAPPTEETKNAK